MPTRLVLTLSMLAGSPLPALALAGKIVDAAGAGKAGIIVSLLGSELTATSGTNGSWTLAANPSSISLQKSYSRGTTGGHILHQGGRLLVSLSGFDPAGRPISRCGTGQDSAATFSFPRKASATADTITYSWNGRVFLRDTTSDIGRSDIPAIFDTTINASRLYGWLLDKRDDQLYRTVQIDTLTWMAMNLNYRATSGRSDTAGRCYGNAKDSCTRYGRLYTWAEAMGESSSADTTFLQATVPHQGLCPDGWHVPSTGNWCSLFKYGDTSASSGSDSVRARLKSLRGWEADINGNGTDIYGFRALPAGNSNDSGTFRGAGLWSFAWSAVSDTDTACTTTNVIVRTDFTVVSGQHTIQDAWAWSFVTLSPWRMVSDKRASLSLRCVKN